MIDQRAIAAYQVGCANVPSPEVDSDVNDVPNYDFSSDIVARSAFFSRSLFRLDVNMVNLELPFASNCRCIDWTKETCIGNWYKILNNG